MIVRKISNLNRKPNRLQPAIKIDLQPNRARRKGGNIGKKQRLDLGYTKNSNSSSPPLETLAVPPVQTIAPPSDGNSLHETLAATNIPNL
ncbi:unnamed protein product [Lactuca virosa]|uniref:Uncharacterized protein n=1 Tax=Lactuca virosa TaxID=75947 RepID=A0AAU9N001_9ASTR|nr:unnamed protein product [Lactuca virosa]